MKGEVFFRSVDEWKSALMNLPENSFFDLLRSVLGNIKTPFSKQKLLDDLHNFLSKDDIRKIIAAYLSEQDGKIIAAVALLREPAPAELETFFAGEFTAAEIRALVINLEERLILYRFRGESPAGTASVSAGSGGPSGGVHDGKLPHLALNPVLEQVLAPFIADTRALFPSFAAEGEPPRPNAGPAANNRPLTGGQPREGGGSPPEPEAPAGTPRTDNLPPAEGQPPKERGAAFSGDGRIMAALFAFLLGADDLFKTEGVFRKKLLDEGARIFPGLDLPLTVQVFLRLGLFRTEGRGLVASRDKVSDYCGLSDRERLEYWAAALYLCRGDSDTGAHSGGVPFEIQDSRLSMYRLRDLASFIHRFRSGIEAGRLYPEITLRRLWEFLGKEDGDLKRSWTSPFFNEKVQYPFEPVLSLLEETGLIERSGTGGNLTIAGNTYTMPAATGASAPATPRDGAASTAGKQEQPEKPVIVMDAAFSFIVYPEIAFTDAVSLGAFCAVKESVETVVRFEITRQSVVRAFDQGMKADDMLALLDRLSRNRLESNLAWTLRDWENRYMGVSLHQGIVLTLAEDRRYLAEAKPVASLILKTLVPGVYLLSTEEKAEVVRALVRAGVDIVAQPPNGTIQGSNGPGKSKEGLRRNSFAPLESSLSAAAYPLALPGSGGKGYGRDDSAARAGKDLFGSGAGAPPPEPSGKRKKSSASAKAAAAAVDSSDSIKENFRRILEPMKLSKQERDELLARIDRRLILTESQLEGASLRYEKLEARGIDYAGKTAIARQAIDSGSLLEVTWPGGPAGDLERITGIAQALEKKENENLLVLRSGEKHDKNARVIRIPLGKISLLRRIKQSIFGE